MSRTDQIGEMRSSVRFPLHLPVAVKAEQDEHQAETADISSGGVLFHLGADLAVGSTIEFSITLPSEVLGAGTEVRVRCVGRVVRSAVHEDRRAVAAVIDEYNFERP